MIKAAAAAGLLDERAAVLEALTGIRRAGADIVITYHAKDVARWLRARQGPQSRKDGAAIPLDETDKQLLNLMQGPFALVRAAVRARRRLAGLERGRGDAARPAPARRADHPRDHADLRHARARLLLDARRRQGRRGVPAPGRAVHQHPPGRHAQLPAQPRLQPLVHARHRAGLQARPAGHARRDRSARPAPSRSASCRR